jgi:hypothetical protein
LVAHALLPFPPGATLLLSLLARRHSLIAALGSIAPVVFIPLRTSCIVITARSALVATAVVALGAASCEAATIVALRATS